jgi:hypothetical protein
MLLSSWSYLRLGNGLRHRVGLWNAIKKEAAIPLIRGYITTIRRVISCYIPRYES